MIATFDLGGTDIKYGIINTEDQLIFHDSKPSKAIDGGIALLDQVCQLVDYLNSLYTIEGVAISSAGVIHPATGVVLSATDTIPNFTGLNINQYIEEKTGLKTTSINDVRAAALSETRHIEEKNVLMMTIGTGIGGAIIYEHQVFHGHFYSAGEWGHMYIAVKPFEKIASMSAIIQEAQSKGVQVNNGIELFKLYDQDHMVVVSIIKKFYHYLSMGIANLVYTINPELIIIGGGISNRGQKFIDELNQALHAHLPKFYVNSVKIICAKNLNHSGMIGAYLHYKKNS